MHVRSWSAALLMLAGTLTAQDKTLRKDVDTLVQKIDGDDALAELKLKAQKSNKPIFLLNVVGELDGKL